ncbi:putative phosphatase regulatory subunit-domain-containing protein [Cristinia sonorae]|uniref:Phosphatase regulatory subunit-domain-containing protein n=1 Tax=Cristinia sonorae TaxID=1940300 RepID=A0A8K0ULV2_9AGAR|nr:putative phosphatase regulatory subunit-domain-containing protein [Cristinia sonorae]
MPYATPASESPPLRPAHRRTRSSFSDERGPGAFAPLGVLPRRRSSKPIFHLNPDDSPSEDHNDTNFTPVGFPVMNSLKFSKDSGRFSPSVDPPSHIDIPPGATSVPFPTSSPLASPTQLPPSSPFIHSPSLPRTPSTPIILSNGKQLKSSLKSSSSSPDFPGDLMRSKHLRAQSAPSTPSAHKNVHFAENGLESVRVFNRTGKPMSVSKPSGDETETETEAENSTAERSMASFPFPSQSSSSLGLSLSSSSQNIVHEIDPSPNMTSPIPASNPPPYANVHLETVTLPRTRPPTLRGTVLVRNIAYEKNVAVRFTLDDWQTTSEVACKHVVSLPGLPPPFPRQELKRDDSDGDLASRIVSGKVHEVSWDRFSFTIRLEDYEAKLAERKLFLVARYNYPGGESWDNNNHQNYRIGFRRSTSTSPLATPVPAAFAPVSQRSFSAPNTLRFTPMSGTLAGIPVVSPSPSRGSPPSTLTRTMSSPYPPSPSLSMDREPMPSTSSNPLQHIPRPTSPTTRETASRTSSYIRRRLSLSNYVAPGSSPTEEKSVVGAQKDGLVTPPTTPPGTIRIKEVVLPGSPPKSRSPPPQSSLADQADAPNVEEMGEIPSEQEEDDDDTPKDERSLRLDTSSLPPSSSNDDLVPFSPTSITAAARPFLPFNNGGYLSPPSSRDASEDGGSGEGGRSSPAAVTPPAATEQDHELSAVQQQMHLQLPDLGLDLSGPAHQRSPAEFELNDESTPSGRVDTSDSSYAAFVRQWCFAQSTPPTPGVHSTPPASSSPRTPASSVSTPLANGHGKPGVVQPPWLGMANDHNAGYGFPGLNFGVNMDVGMVGGELHQ